MEQSVKNDLKREQMKNISYSFIIGSIMYAWVCTRPDITYTIEMLSSYQSNLGLGSCKESQVIPLRD